MRRAKKKKGELDIEKKKTLTSFPSLVILLILFPFYPSPFLCFRLPCSFVIAAFLVAFTKPRFCSSFSIPDRHVFLSNFFCLFLSLFQLSRTYLVSFFISLPLFSLLCMCGFRWAHPYLGLFPRTRCVLIGRRHPSFLPFYLFFLSLSLSLYSIVFPLPTTTLSLLSVACFRAGLWLRAGCATWLPCCSSALHARWRFVSAFVFCVVHSVDFPRRASFSALSICIFLSLNHSSASPFSFLVGFLVLFIPFARRVHFVSLSLSLLSLLTYVLFLFF